MPVLVIVPPVLLVSIGTKDLLPAPVSGLGRRLPALINAGLAMTLLALTPPILFLEAMVRLLEIMAVLLETLLSMPLGSPVPGPLGTSLRDRRLFARLLGRLLDRTIILPLVAMELSRVIELLTITLRNVQVGVIVMEVANVIVDSVAMTPIIRRGEITC